MENDVILVNEQDNQIGTKEKMEAHREGSLHRAFSIFIFNNKNEMLLQQRAIKKYHSGGLWTNTCCSHPKPNENIDIAAHRRLEEEMGFDTKLNEAFSFTYFVELDRGLKEHEYDHVFIGNYGGNINPNPNEVESFKWVSMDALKQDIKKNPKNYTEWFKISILRVLEFYNREAKK